MSYKQSISSIFALRRFGIKPGLKNITRLMSCLGNPHKDLNMIHLAGTNGKGSTAAFLHSILNRSGYKTGMYTSPHLIDFCERIKVKDTQIRKKRAAELIQQIRNTCLVNKLNSITFFEFTTALALFYFKEMKADPVIIETGLGGKYDSTNIIDPILSIITNISLEHQKYLGTRITDITREKAGIIKKNRPVVSGIKQQKARAVIEDLCRKKDSSLFLLKRDFKTRRISGNRFKYKSNSSEIDKIETGLIGTHQILNAALAVKASEILMDSGYNISGENIREGIKTTFWPGRLEIISENPKIILDGAHNPDAWKNLKAAINTFNFKKLYLIVGVSNDKNIKYLINCLIPMASKTLFSKADIDRAAGREKIKKLIVFPDNKRLFWYDNPVNALKAARAEAGSEDLILITGSLFIVGEIRQFILNKNLNVSGRIPL